jgi:glucose/arabinose dehydrogenase
VPLNDYQVSLNNKLDHFILDYLYLVFAFCTLLVALIWHCSVSYGSVEPFLSNEKLVAEKVAGGLENPTNFAFIGANDILVLEKNKGTVLRIQNGEVLPEPILDVNVANQVEQGMLGIAVSENLTDNKIYVFLYYTEAGGETGEGEGERDEDEGTNGNVEQRNSGDGGEPLGNRLYRYELSEDRTKLLNPKLLLDLPYEPGPAHNGGVVTVGPDNNVYVVVGNLLANAEERFDGYSLDQNIINGMAPDGRGGILRVTQDGKIVDGKGILGNEHPLDMYFAYGIRNSFGIAFDPLTGNLWDTENGGNYDEINLVEPGFNSGWEKVIGKASLVEGFDLDDLVDFNGNGEYSDPEFSWATKSNFRTAPTSIVFFNSDKLGKQYENEMFVADVHGNIYHFTLDRDRIKLILNGPLADEIAGDLSELEELIFAEFPGIITELKVGPDGYLYVLVYREENGELFRIAPSST